MVRLKAGAFVFAAAMAAATAEAAQPDLILVGGRVLTGEATRPTAEAVAVEGDRIRAVGLNEDVQRLRGPETRVVDLRGRTVIPGLVDAHVHLFSGPGIIDEPALRRYEQTVLPGVMSGFISRGITTVRSTGDGLPYIVQLRDRMESAATGPRVVATGPPLTSPDGHPAATMCRGNPFCRRAVPELADEEQARRVVRELAAAKVNAVKVIVDDVIAKVPALADQILRALVEETHAHRLRVIAHVSVRDSLSTTRRLVAMGVDEFVHPPIDGVNRTDAAEVVALLARRRIPVTTTVSPFDAYTDVKGLERSLIGGRPFAPWMRQRFEGLLDDVRRLAEANVRLVAGTDWFNRRPDLNDPRLLPGASTLHELDLLHRAGLSTPVVLAAATRHAAEALQIIDTLGTITEGKLADLVILDGDLQQDFSVLHRPVTVFKAGHIAHGSLP
jgi:imidazolonepropionase-like amidohydrolase